MKTPMGDEAKKASAKALAKMRGSRRIVCEECGKNDADPPGRICVGCEAYRDHTGHF